MGSSAHCYGVRVGFRSNTKKGLSALQKWSPRALRSGRARIVDGLYSLVFGGNHSQPGVKRFHVLYRDATRIARTLDLEEVRRAFKRDISMLIGAGARRRIFIHAGVVAMGGGAVLVPGRTFSGKTTLIQALAHEGGVYYSDEYAVLDARGRVSPWAEPLSVRTAGPMKAGEERTAVSLGLVSGHRPLKVKMVVLTSFEEGRKFQPETVSTAAGTLGLLEHTLPARQRPRDALQALVSAVREARVVRGPRGDAKQAAKVIVRILAESPPD